MTMTRADRIYWTIICVMLFAGGLQLMPETHDAKWVLGLLNNAGGALIGWWLCEEFRD